MSVDITFFFGLCIEDTSNSDCTQSNAGRLVDNDLESIWKEAVVV
jgi:hypothetical protein